MGCMSQFYTIADLAPTEAGRCVRASFRTQLAVSCCSSLHTCQYSESRGWWWVSSDSELPMGQRQLGRRAPCLFCCLCWVSYGHSSNSQKDKEKQVLKREEVRLEGGKFEYLNAYKRNGKSLIWREGRQPTHRAGEEGSKHQQTSDGSTLKQTQPRTGRPSKSLPPAISHFLLHPFLNHYLGTTKYVSLWKVCIIEQKFVERTSSSERCHQGPEDKEHAKVTLAPLYPAMAQGSPGGQTPPISGLSLLGAGSKPMRLKWAVLGLHINSQCVPQSTFFPTSSRRLWGRTNMNLNKSALSVRACLDTIKTTKLQSEEIKAPGLCR